ncbi:MAG: carbohydrate-binding domain-containing protein [Anaerohalosphaeraceae bacterium]
MKSNKFSRAVRLGLYAALWLGWSGFVLAETVSFSTADAGQVKSVPEWGVDTAWPSRDNMRISIAHMGLDAIDIIRLNFYMDEPLTANGEIADSSKAKINNQLSIAAMAGSKPLMLTPATGDGVHSWYKNGSQVWPDRWAQLIEATQAYINRPIAAVEPFNEPDYSPWNQGTPQNLYDILGLLQNSPRFQGTLLGGPSVLNSDTARTWYDVIKSRVHLGSTHQLAGSTNSYVNFLQYVKANGAIPHNPELHSLAEAIYGAEYGLGGGIWWGPVVLPRGVFVRASDGRRLGYSENRGKYSAAAVYRAPDGKIYGFAGCFERQGALTPYRFVCTDRDVYYNGIGPIRAYMVNVNQGQDAYIEIETDNPVWPALDGNRWKIVNRQTGRVAEVANAGMQDGADIRQAVDTDGLHQKWNLLREMSGYFLLFAAHSGRTAEVANWSTSNGANIRQWGMGENFLQRWFLEYAGDGYFYIRNAHSCKYMTASGTATIYQWDFTGSYTQQWRFVPANPPVNGTLRAYYEFEDSVLDSTFAYHGTASGSPAYTVGRIGRAIVLDGVDDFVSLPAGVVNTTDFTAAAWVYWNSGGNWQRLFDFGGGTSEYLFLTPRSGANTLRFAITKEGNANEQILETDPLPIGQWVHVAVTLCGHTGILYVNGTPRVAGQIRLDPSEINAVNNAIGKSQFSGDPYFNGRIDDFRIYNYALTPEAVQDLYQMITMEGPYGGQPAVIPGRIEAEEYDYGPQGTAYYDTTIGNSGGVFRLPTDVDIRSISDFGSGFAVTNIAAGEWLRYTVNVTESGVYCLYLRASATGNNLPVTVKLDNAVLGTVWVNSTGSLDTFGTFMLNSLTLEGGTGRVLELSFPAGGLEVNWVEFQKQQSPWGGMARGLPGRVEAEDFDFGGPGYAYWDTTAGNSGGAYRTYESVDIVAVTDGSAGYAVDSIESGEWLTYTVSTQPSVGNLFVYARAASIQSGGQIRVWLDADLLATVAVPNTGSLTAWQTVKASCLPLPQKDQAVLKLEFVGSGFRMNWIEIARQVPYWGSPFLLPGRIEMEDFDIGGQGVSYFDTTPGNSYGGYRTDVDVDIMTIWDGGAGFGVFMESGEWLEYTCSVQPGLYALRIRYTTNQAVPSLQLLDSTAGTLLADISLASTGGWSSWQDAVIEGISLSNGPDRGLRFVLNSPHVLVNNVEFIRRYNPADLNRSGLVDLEDFSILSSQWLGEPGEPSADTAPSGGDGWVGLEDLADLADNWLIVQ